MLVSPVRHRRRRRSLSMFFFVLPTSACMGKLVSPVLDKGNCTVRTFRNLSRGPMWGQSDALHPQAALQPHAAPPAWQTVAGCISPEVGEHQREAYLHTHPLKSALLTTAATLKTCFFAFCKEKRLRIFRDDGHVSAKSDFFLING